MPSRVRAAAPWVAWALTRLAVLVLVAGPERAVVGDVKYYVQSLDRLPHAGLAHVLVEYPLPAVAVIALPLLLAHVIGAAAGGVWIVVAALALATDGAFLWLVRRSGRRGSRTPDALAAWVWIVGPPLLGATPYARFDMVPAVLVGVALLVSARRPVVAGALTAVGTAVKLWPVLLAPALASRRGERGRLLAAVVLTGAGLAALCVALAGWSRLFSPLTYQTDRGLQVESVAATPVLLARMFDPGRYEVYFSQYRAIEIRGRGAGWMLHAGTVAEALLALTLLVLWWRAWRAERVSADGISWLCLSAVTGFIVVSKVCSPQYLLWLLPLAVAALLRRTPPRAGRSIGVWCALLLLTAALTQLEYPLGYHAVTHWEAGWSVVVSLTLALRNALLVVLLLTAVWEAWRHLGASAPVSEEGRSPAIPPGRAETTA